MSIVVATSIARILKAEGVEWVSAFPVRRANNALWRESVPMIMMCGDRIGVCMVQGGANGVSQPAQ